MDDDNSISPGVNLIAYIRAEMGLGTAARGLALAMESARIPFNVINFEYQNPSLHRDTGWQHKEVDSSAHDFTILAVNPDNIFNARDRVLKEFVRAQYTIGYWFWELPDFPDAWLPAFSLVDEVWTASRFVQDSLSMKSPVPVWRVPMAIRLGPADKFSRASFSLPQRQFLFLSMSDTHSTLERKNPLGVVHAFKQAFSGNNRRVGLVLKISNADSPFVDSEAMAQIREEIKDYRNIYLLDREMTRAEIDSLLAVCDCFVSLHRSEGFGLGPAEAMSLGKPVILTSWSGNTDYMTLDNSIGIDYQLIPVGKVYGHYQPDQIWADPDLEQAAYWMKHVAQDDQLAARMGLLGQETIKEKFSPEAAGKLIERRLHYLRTTVLSQRSVAETSNR